MPISAEEKNDTANPALQIILNIINRNCSTFQKDQASLLADVTHLEKLKALNAQNIPRKEEQRDIAEQYDKNKALTLNQLKHLCQQYLNKEENIGKQLAVTWVSRLHAFTSHAATGKLILSNCARDASYQEIFGIKQSSINELNILITLAFAISQLTTIHDAFLGELGKFALLNTATKQKKINAIPQSDIKIIEHVTNIFSIILFVSLCRDKEGIPENIKQHYHTFLLTFFKCYARQTVHILDSMRDKVITLEDKYRRHFEKHNGSANTECLFLAALPLAIFTFFSLYQHEKTFINIVSKLILGLVSSFLGYAGYAMNRHRLSQKQQFDSDIATTKTNYQAILNTCKP